jgi:uncharacterized protein YjiS (DUF1127 family)
VESFVIMSDAAYPVARARPAAFPPLGAEPVGLFGRWLAQRAKRRTLHALQDLPPYLLDDIGLLQQGDLPSRRPTPTGL